MPRGRFTSKSFYHSDRLNALPVIIHHLFGGLYIVCADREGRLKGQARWINGQVLSGRNFTDGQVEGFLNQLWEAKDEETGLGLIERYEANGKNCIWIPGFDKHQKGMDKRKEAESEIPPPPAELMTKARDLPLSAFAITQTSEDKRTLKQIKSDDDFKVAGMIKYYEDTLGRMLTPPDLERMIDFADTYEDGWFEKAVDEAKKNDAKVPLRYIEKILETWKLDGGPDGGKRTGVSKGHTTSSQKLRDSTTGPLR